MSRRAKTSEGDRAPIIIRPGRRGSIATAGSFALRNPAAAAEWCLELNMGAGPDEVTANNGQKAYFRCSSCRHIWLSEIKSRHRTGCPVCSINRRSAAVRQGKLHAGSTLIDVYPSIAAEWDASANELEAKDFAPKSNFKVAWICSTCGHRWRATVASRTQSGAGCPKCSPKKKSSSIRDAIVSSGRSQTLDDAAKVNETAKRLMAEWDHAGNELPPSRVTVGSRYRAWWSCRHGHRWRASVDSRFKRGDGCMECSKGRRVSRIELLALAEARHIWGAAEHQARVAGREVDVLVSRVGIAIEVDGDFHRSASAPARDRRKTQVLQTAGLRVFRLRQRDCEDLHDGSEQVWGTRSRLHPDDVVRLYRLIAETTGDPDAARYARAGKLAAEEEAARLWREVSTMGGPTRRAPSLTCARIDELKTQGMTQRAIAEMYGVSAMVVSRRSRD